MQNFKSSTATVIELRFFMKKMKKKRKMKMQNLINPRRACAARVAVVGLCVCVCVCVCVYRSVTALAASASVYTCNQRYSRVFLRLFLDFDSWIFEKPFRSKVMV